MTIACSLSRLPLLSWSAINLRCRPDDCPAANVQKNVPKNRCSVTCPYRLSFRFFSAVRTGASGKPIALLEFVTRLIRFLSEPQLLEGGQLISTACVHLVGVRPFLIPRGHLYVSDPRFTKSFFFDICIRRSSRLFRCLTVLVFYVARQQYNPVTFCLGKKYFLTFKFSPLPFAAILQSQLHVRLEASLTMITATHGIFFCFLNASGRRNCLKHKM